MSDQLVKATQQGAFIVRPEEALEQIRNIQAVVKEVMQNGEHYGTIPGTSKPTLLKPGAELLNNMYGFFLDSIEIVEKAEQWDVPITQNSFPLFRYVTKCVLKNRDGITIATGIGECNSYEVKYRWRDSTRKCPACGKETIIKGKKEYGGGWLCFAKKGGCGAKYGDNDEQITSQSVGRAPNENIYDQINTILKMSKKRSYVDATLSATRTSGTFTQDLEDFAGLADVQEASFEVVKDKPQAVPVAGATVDEPSKLKNEDYIIPVTIHKGKKLKDISKKDLESAIAWCKNNPGKDAEKKKDFIEKAEAFLKDDGLSVFDKTVLPLLKEEPPPVFTDHPEEALVESRKADPDQEMKFLLKAIEGCQKAKGLDLILKRCDEKKNKEELTNAQANIVYAAIAEKRLTFA